MRRLFVVALVVLVCGETPHADQAPSLKTVVRRVAAYVQAYGEKASIVVATERYTQDVTSNSAAARRYRAVVAEFAIVKIAGLGDWVGFRDVVEVDGRRITDREDRLLQALMTGTGGFDEARRISDESARFNIGPILRNFNVPTTALFFFTPDNFDRFKFKRKDVTPAVWEIAFRETRRPTLIRTPEGASVPAAGSLWVNPQDGTVLRTRLEVFGFATPAHSGDAGTHGAIDVTYHHIDAVDMWLPDTMVETFEGSHGPVVERTRGEARYSNYRRFETSVRIK
ncbi:MAG: hypothetical protein DMF84_21025 [Acidobacteria bacterium]|nr:MAG: hypothetical protein DMF84_21025 [Acidobacteriota bacterium]